MKFRESNIELLRLVAMLLILLVHANYFALGGVEIQDIESYPFKAFMKALAEQLCIIGPNLFILISGWFGIRPSIKGGCALLFQVFFYHILIVLVSLCCGEDPSMNMIAWGFYFGRPYWFIISYIILYLISPILNAFHQTANVRLYLSVLILFFIAEFVYGWVIDPGSFGSGYSAWSFIGLYLLSGFLRKNSKYIIKIGHLWNIVLYIFWTIVPVALYFVTKHTFNMLAYSSPFVILASIHFFLAFVKIKINSKTINYFAGSALSIYLIHQHPLIIEPFVTTLKNAYLMLGGFYYVLFVLIAAIVFSGFCVMFDKIRILAWNTWCNKFFDKAISKFQAALNDMFTLIGY